MDNNYLKVLNLVKEVLSQQGDKATTLLKIAEILKKEVEHYDWVGFYWLNKETNALILGPFCGKPTEHVNIPVGKGVCGQVAENKTTMVVQDVSKQSNYIACSMDVQSEIVVPILRNGMFLAEIDIDSHAYAPFTNEDEQLLQAIANEIEYLF